MQLWQGVVEDRNDPLMLGRVRVRILGLDSEVKNIDKNRGIPTEDLLWAYPMQPITSAAMNGIGDAPLGMVEGTWVVGFFRDSAQQDAVIMGTTGGIPRQVADGSKGFNDPSGKYPKSDHINEPDTNRLARNESISKTYIQKVKDQQETGIKQGTATYDEPLPTYAAKYPHNKVNESESGHVTEVDDTPGFERTTKYHKSGTFEEISADGTRVQKIIGDDYEIVVKDKKAYIKGNLAITVDGNATIDVGGTTSLNSVGHVEIQAPSVDVGINGKEPAVLGDKYQAQIDHLTEIFNQHFHQGNLGAPTSTAAIAGFTQIWMDALSKSIEVQS